VIHLDPNSVRPRGIPRLVLFAVRYLDGSDSVADVWRASGREATELRGAQRIERLSQRLRFCLACRRELCPACHGDGGWNCTECLESQAERVGPVSRVPGIGLARRAIRIEGAAIRDVGRLRRRALRAPLSGAEATEAFVAIARLVARTAAAEKLAAIASRLASTRHRATAEQLGGDMEAAALTFRVELASVIAELEARASTSSGGPSPDVSAVIRGAGTSVLLILREQLSVRGVLRYGARFLRRLASASATVAIAALGLILVTNVMTGGAGAPTRPPPQRSGVLGGQPRPTAVERPTPIPATRLTFDLLRIGDLTVGSESIVDVERGPQVVSFPSPFDRSISLAGAEPQGFCVSAPGLDLDHARLGFDVYDEAGGTPVGPLSVSLMPAASASWTVSLPDAVLSDMPVEQWVSISLEWQRNGSVGFEMRARKDNLLLAAQLLHPDEATSAASTGKVCLRLAGAAATTSLLVDNLAVGPTGRRDVNQVTER
jgi:hypothetical protein